MPLTAMILQTGRKGGGKGEIWLSHNSERSFGTLFATLPRSEPLPSEFDLCISRLL